MPNTDDLQTIPGVGPSIAADLTRLGVGSVPDLRGRDPGALYRRLCRLTGTRQDPCVLYVFRCAVHFAETPDPDPESCKWWNWKGRTHANETDASPAPTAVPRARPAPGPARVDAADQRTWERVYEVVRRIPRGRVATYGQVARLAGLGGHARAVGYALSACDEDLPWHRVINARGEISERSDPWYEERQRDLLEREGVAFDGRGRTDLARFRWGAGVEDPCW